MDTWEGAGGGGREERRELKRWKENSNNENLRVGRQQPFALMDTNRVTHKPIAGCSLVACNCSGYHIYTSLPHTRAVNRDKTRRNELTLMCAFLCIYGLSHPIASM